MCRKGMNDWGLHAEHLVALVRTRQFHQTPVVGEFYGVSFRGGLRA